jgi:hypothetical protein
MATLVQSANEMRQFVLIMTLGLVFVFVLKKSVMSDRPTSALLFLSIGIVIAVEMYFNGLLRIFMSAFLNEKPSSKNHGIHVSPEVWKYIGLIVGALAFFAIAFLVAMKVVAWYNSPAKVEARALCDNEALQRIQRGLADNPDYQDLSDWKKQLAKRQSPEAKALMVEIDRLHEEIRSQEETAALAPIADGLAEIRFKNDPAKRAETPE